MFKKVCSATILLFAFYFSFVLLGNESSSKYFPDTLDSYWIYEDQGGNEFTRRAVEGEEIGDEVLSAFSYEPELENWKDYSLFFRPSLYKVNDEGIMLVVSDDVEKASKARLKYELDFFIESMMRIAPQGGSIDVDIVTEAKDDFLLLPDTVVVNEEWDVAQKKAEIKLTINDPTYGGPEPETISFVFDIYETGIVIGTETVIVPAGTYEDCLKVQYRTETTLSLFPKDAVGPDNEDIEPPGESVTTVWFAPKVGIVKYHQERQHIFLEVIPDDVGIPIVKPDDPKPITYELIKYEIKAEDTDSENNE